MPDVTQQASSEANMLKKFSSLNISLLFLKDKDFKETSHKLLLVKQVNKLLVKQALV